MIKDKEITQASDALMEWFKSQELTPVDGTLVMCRLIATQLHYKSNDPDELQRAANDVKLILVLELAMLLKGEG